LYGEVTAPPAIGGAARTQLRRGYGFGHGGIGIIGIILIVVVILLLTGRL